MPNSHAHSHTLPRAQAEGPSLSMDYCAVPILHTHTPIPHQEKEGKGVESRCSDTPELPYREVVQTFQVGTDASKLETVPKTRPGGPMRESNTGAWSPLRSSRLSASPGASPAKGLGKRCLFLTGSLISQASAQPRKASQQRLSLGASLCPMPLEGTTKSKSRPGCLLGGEKK